MMAHPAQPEAQVVQISEIAEYNEASFETSSEEPHQSAGVSMTNYANLSNENAAIGSANDELSENSVDDISHVNSCTL